MSLEMKGNIRVWPRVVPVCDDNRARCHSSGQLGVGSRSRIVASQVRVFQYINLYHVRGDKDNFDYEPSTSVSGL